MDKQVERVGTVAGTAAVDNPVVHTAAVDMAVWGKMVVGHTGVVVGTGVVEGRPEVAVAAVDNQLPEVEDMH